MTVPPYPNQPPPGYPEQPGGWAPGPQYPPPYPYGRPPAPTNSLAIAALVCAFLFAPLGIIFGHMSLSQIKRTGEEGRTLAIIGLVVGYVTTVFAVLAVIFVIIIAIVAANSERNDPYDWYQASGPGYSATPP